MDIEPLVDAQLLTTLNATATVIFVCSGNIIRSAYADIYSRHLCIDKVRVLSAGTTFRNDEVHERTREALTVKGVSPHLINSFSPTYFEDMDLSEDMPVLIFGMTKNHLNDVKRIKPELAPVCFLLLELIGKKEDIGDPYFEGNWEQAYKDISSCVENLVRLVKTDDEIEI